MKSPLFVTVEEGNRFPSSYHTATPREAAVRHCKSHNLHNAYVTVQEWKAPPAPVTFHIVLSQECD